MQLKVTARGLSQLCVVLLVTGVIVVVVGVILGITRVDVMKGSCRDETRPGIRYMVQRGEGAQVPQNTQIMHYLYKNLQANCDLLCNL